MKEYTVKVYEDRTEWYLNGKYHREDGPAIEYADGSKSWYLNDQRHREDGPATEWTDGSKSWYLNGIQYNEAEFITKTTVQEMTMEELCKELGRTIKIKK